jgi:hypothetical protein
VLIDAIAIAAALVLLAIAGLHVYWSGGGRWPRHDVASPRRCASRWPPG